MFVKVPIIFVRAIDLLYHIGITDLVFGSECGDIDTFKEIAYAIKNHPNEYDQYVKAAMKKDYVTLMLVIKL